MLLIKTKGVLVMVHVFLLLKRIVLASSMFLFVITLDLHYTIFAQTIPRISISGQIIDKVTGNPLSDVNVFLSGTTLGDVTDENGKYLIRRVPLGTYELVVSMMGYKRETGTIHSAAPVNRELNFKLMPSILKGEEITVSATYPKQWKQNLKRFKRHFLGTSKNAQKCEIINPEILDFEFNEVTNVLTANAKKPLQIENKALGYRIEVFLDRFIFRSETEGTYSYKSKFQPLQPKNEKEKQRWDKERKRAYNGSIRHFFTALVTDRLWQEGFTIYNTPGFIPKDSKGNFNLYKIEAKDILYPAKNSYEKKLSFINLLDIHFRNEDKEERNIERLLVYRQDDLPGQRSWISLISDTLIINSMGISNNPNTIGTTGYWAWERFAEDLPLDYLPDEKAKSVILQTLLPETYRTKIDSFNTVDDISPAESVDLIKQAYSQANDQNVLETIEMLYNGLKNIRNHPYTDTLYKELQCIMSDDEIKAY